MNIGNRTTDEPREIFEILERCASLSIAMNDVSSPYVIPVTFGCTLEEDRIVIYIHSARTGKKWELLSRDPKVCVEAHLYYRTEQEGGRITARYESVVGRGRAELLTEQKDKVDAFKIMLAHYNSSGFPATSCTGLKKAEVFRIVLDEVTGKKSL